MKILRPLLTVSVLVLGLILVLCGEASSRPSRRPAGELGRTSPPINLTHIFEGEIYPIFTRN